MPASTSHYTELNGRRAFVTGGANSIGRVIAHALAQAAFKWRSPISMPKRLSERRRRSTRARSRLRSTCASARRSSARLARRLGFGGCDICIANAGVSTMQRALDLTDAEWDFNFAVNARGIFLTNQIAARHFVAQASGCIVNTASLAARVGAPLLAHYSASKFAVLGWTQALARELAPKGIRVNVVCPRFVKTGMQSREIEWESRLRNLSAQQVVDDYLSQTPLGRLEEPEDVADVVVFLCSDKARFMTGQGINVTGGAYMT